MGVPLPKSKMSVSKLARTLMAVYDDLPISEIIRLEEIMKRHGETDPTCWLVDQITNWVYEDVNFLMPVSVAYDYVMDGILNE